MTAAADLALGYQGIPPTAGFGSASMNALSPVWPALSNLAATRFPMLDATGEQYEGYQYLGFGLIMLIVVCVTVACLSERTAFLQRHWGLLLCALAITSLAMSNRIFVGDHKIADFGEVPPFVEQLRSSGRLFWVVTYIALVGTVAVVGRLLPRWLAYCILVSLVAVQFADTRMLRASVRGIMHGNAQRALPLDPKRVEALLAHHRRLTLSPVFGCGADWADLELQQLSLGAPRNHVTVNTAYAARFPTIPECDTTEFGLPLAEGELRVFLPLLAQTGPLIVPDGRRLCRQFSRVAICTRQMGLLADLLPVEAPIAAFDVEYSPVTGKKLPLLGPGWSGPEPSGTWTNAGSALLVAQLPDIDASDLTFSLTGHGFTGKAAVPQSVDVLANDHKVASWDVSSRQDMTYSTIIPAADLVKGPQVIRLRIATPTRPSDAGMGSDWRALGLFVQSFRFGSAKHD